MSSVTSKDRLAASNLCRDGSSDKGVSAAESVEPQGRSYRARKQPEPPVEIKVSAQEWASNEDDDCRCEHLLQIGLFTQDIHELPDRDWPVAQMLEVKLEKSERFYKVQWSEIQCLEIFLRKPRDGEPYVMIAGASWPVESYQDSTCTKCYTPLVKVRWKATWKHERDLQDARGRISDFYKAHGLPSPLASNDGECIQVRTPASELNRQPLETQPGECRDPEPEASVSHKIPTEKFRPRAGVEYSGGDFRQALSRLSKGPSPLLELWRPEMDQRSLSFRPRYIALGHEFDLGRPEKARGILSYFCGSEQRRPCRCCEKDTGFFTKCVVSTFSTNGACANCQCGGNERQCNYHGESKTDRWLAELPVMPTPPPSSPMGDSSPNSEAERPTLFAHIQPSPTLPMTDSGSRRHRSSRPSTSLTGPQAPYSCNCSLAACNGCPVSGPSAQPHFGHILLSSSSDEELTRDQQTKPEPSNVWTLPRIPVGKRRHEEDAAQTRKKFCSEASFCVTTARAVWRNEDFRHEGCGMDVNEACQVFDVYENVCFPECERIRTARRVMDPSPFKVGVAIDAEVRYILHKCPCSFMQSFNEAWRSWEHENSKMGVTKETFFSVLYTDKLNEAKDRFCPSKLHDKAGREVIAID